MKRTVKTYIYALAILLASCADKADYSILLKQSDSLMESRPDSALTLLDGIPTKELKTDADRAYYALLLTQARDKNYIKQRDDSLIQSAISYYNQTSNTEMQARSYYYCGCVYRDLKDEKKAMSNFLTAKTLAKDSKNLLLLSLICNNIGYVFYTNDLNEQADSAYHEVQQTAIHTESLKGALPSRKIAFYTCIIAIIHYIYTLFIHMPAMQNLYICSINETNKKYMNMKKLLFILLAFISFDNVLYAAVEKNDDEIEML